MKVLNFYTQSVLARSLWQFRREFVIVGLLSLFSNLLMLTPTLYMIQVYDRVLLSRNEMTLLFISVLTILLFLGMAIIEWMRSHILILTGIRLDNLLSSRVFNAGFEAHLRSDENYEPALSDLVQVRQFVTGSGIVAFLDAPWTIVYILVLFILHPAVGFFGVFAVFIQVLLIKYGQQPITMNFESAQKSKIRAITFLQSKLFSADVIEAMGMTDGLKRRWKEISRSGLLRNYCSQELALKVASWSKFVRYGQQSAALGIGALLVIDNELSPGAMIAANVLVNRALSPIDSMVNGWRQFASMKNAFSRLDKLLDRHSIQTEEVEFKDSNARVSLIDVTASAASREKPILNSLNLDFPAGSVNLILGPSGSGKSTFAKVVVGIWPDLSGKVLINNREVFDRNRFQNGRFIGYLPQDIQLLDGTIAENIAGFGDIDPSKVVEAAHNTNLHRMILKLPRGYDTQIAEAAGVLTGGQRQRIGLARAMYDYPSIVVLDEPNSNLDEEGTLSLHEAINLLKKKGSTVFLISHRPIDISAVDHILLLKEGSIKAFGTTESVIELLQAQESPAEKNCI